MTFLVICKTSSEYDSLPLPLATKLWILFIYISWPENAKVLSDIFWHFTCYSFTFYISLLMDILKAQTNFCRLLSGTHNTLSTRNKSYINTFKLSYVFMDMSIGAMRYLNGTDPVTLLTELVYLTGVTFRCNSANPLNYHVSRVYSTKEFVNLLSISTLLEMISHSSFVLDFKGAWFFSHQSLTPAY